MSYADERPPGQVTEEGFRQQWNEEKFIAPENIQADSFGEEIEQDQEREGKENFDYFFANFHFIRVGLARQLCGIPRLLHIFGCCGWQHALENRKDQDDIS